VALVNSGVLILDLQGQILSVDPDAHEILETGDELQGKHLSELWSDSPLPGLWSEMSQSKAVSHEFISTWTAKPKTL